MEDQLDCERKLFGGLIERLRREIALSERPSLAELMADYFGGTWPHQHSVSHRELWLVGAYELGPAVAASHRVARSTAEALREADTPSARRAAVRDLLLAMAELVLFLVGFLAAGLMLVLSRSLGRTSVDHAMVQKPDPIDTTPQITPRGPNSAFPVGTHRGGRRSSALGSVVVAA